MTVTAVHKDPDALTLTLTAEFDATPERVWDLWADPRKLERWWGPPTYPATFTQHDLAPGSHVEYHMTGPTGDQPHGFWDIVEADPPRRLVYRRWLRACGWHTGRHVPAQRRASSRSSRSTPAGRGCRSRATSRAPRPSSRWSAMGMVEGLTEAVGQIDAILAEDPARRQVLTRQIPMHDFDDLIGEWRTDGRDPVRPAPPDHRHHRRSSTSVPSSSIRATAEPGDRPGQLSSIVGGAPDGTAATDALLRRARSQAAVSDDGPGLDLDDLASARRGPPRARRPGLRSTLHRRRSRPTARASPPDGKRRPRRRRMGDRLPHRLRPRSAAPTDTSEYEEHTTMTTMTAPRPARWKRPARP